MSLTSVMGHVPGALWRTLSLVQSHALVIETDLGELFMSTKEFSLILLSMLSAHRNHFLIEKERETQSVTSHKHQTWDGTCSWPKLNPQHSWCMGQGSKHWASWPGLPIEIILKIYIEKLGQKSMKYQIPVLLLTLLVNENWYFVLFSAHIIFLWVTFLWNVYLWLLKVSPGLERAWDLWESISTDFYLCSLQNLPPGSMNLCLNIHMVCLHWLKWPVFSGQEEFMLL